MHRRRAEVGASLVEYALLVGVVAAAAAFALWYVGDGVSNVLRDAFPSNSARSPQRGTATVPPTGPGSRDEATRPVANDNAPLERGPVMIAAALLALNGAGHVVLRRWSARPSVTPVLVPTIATAHGPVRSVVADDSDDYRALLGAVLDVSGAFAVVGEAADGREALRVAAQHEPALIVLDLNMPEMTGGEALPLLRQAHPDAAIVVLSAMFRAEEESGYRDLGASACFLKSTPPAQLVTRLAAVCGVEPMRASSAGDTAGGHPVGAATAPA